MSRALLSIVNYDDAGSDFFDTDGTDGGDGDGTMAIVLERIEAICATFKLPLSEVAEVLQGYAEFMATEDSSKPVISPAGLRSGGGESRRRAFTLIPGGKARLNS
jgi:hypothetical protein